MLTLVIFINAKCFLLLFPVFVGHSRKAVSYQSLGQVSATDEGMWQWMDG